VARDDGLALAELLGDSLAFAVSSAPRDQAVTAGVSLV